MTLNANFPGYRAAVRPKTLEGRDRGLDALVGLVILLAELAIGYLSFFAIYSWAIRIAPVSTEPEWANLGVNIALFGGGFFFLLTTVIYLARVAMARRAWTAPLWGLILMSATLILAAFVTSAAA